MSNIINYVNKTTMIDSRLKQAEDYVIQMHDAGYSDEEILHAAKTQAADAFKNLGKPTFKLKKASDVPDLMEYNPMVQAAINDMSSIIEDGMNLGNSQKGSFVNDKMFMTMTNSRINYLNKSLDSIEKNVSSSLTSGGNVMITETFSSTENSAQTSAASDRCNVDTSAGTLTLGMKKQVNAGSMTAEILPGSIGFPGNTHMASSVGGKVTFAGETSLNMDLNLMLDGKEDTWFEYEAIKLDGKTMEKIAGLGTEYLEGISWVTDGNKGQVNLTCRLKSPMKCNMINLKSFLPSVKGCRPPIVRRITVASSDESEMNTVISDKLFGDTISAIFPLQEVASITLDIEQTSPYDVEIGHFFYSNSGNNPETAVRIQGEDPSLLPLGMRYNPADKTLVQQKSHDENGRAVQFNENVAVEELFGFDSRHPNCYRELIAGKRYAIGIRDIAVSSSQFYETSTYISKEFTMPDTINTIELESDETIPTEYGAGEWIRYYISIDGGKEWMPIFPRHRGYAGPSTYKINSTNMTYSKDGNVKYIYRLSDAEGVRVKIEMRRPSVSEFTTPIVYSYNLNVKTGDEDID